jgi:hypothetical protein
MLVVSFKKMLEDAYNAGVEGSNSSFKQYSEKIKYMQK